MSSTKELIRRIFDESASQFDEIGTPSFRYFGEKLAGFADIQPDDHILDIACGKGATTFPMMEKISGKGRISAIDISTKMIEECKRKTHNVTNQIIDFRVMDAENLEFDNDSMDKVICGFGLFFLTDIEKGLSEIKRVLKPDGLLVFSSWNDEYRLK